MRTAVVYYSLEGNTDFAAHKIAEATGADLVRLHPTKEYPRGGLRKFIWGGKSAMMAEAPNLEPYEFDATAYDLVILGFPVWASTIAPPIRTFLKQNDLSGLRVATFACQSAKGAEKAFTKLKECLNQHTLIAELVLIDPKEKPSEENDRKLQAFCAALQ